MEAATYFFFNSTLLVVVLAIVFFLLGLWLGWVLWGKCCSKSEAETEQPKSEPQPLVSEEPKPAEQPAAAAEEPAAEESMPQAWNALRGDVSTGKARVDDTLGLLYNERPDEEDDLTAIKGVAGVLKGKLNDFGVYRYRQIAGWNDAIIAEFSTRLSFKDRVQRDDWVGQCKALHKEKYGEDLD